MTKKHHSKPYGTRAALLALALSGTISGWAILAGNTDTQTSNTPAAIVEIAAPSSVSASPNLLSPIPTLVAPPAGSSTTELAQSSSLSPIPNLVQATTARPLVRSRSSR